MKPSRVSKIGAEQDLRESSLTHPSPPRPNLKEIEQFVKDLRDPVNQEYGGFNARAADLIDSLLSERDEARGALRPFAEEARAFEGDVSDDLHLTVRDEDGETVNTTISVGDLRRAARAMRGNAE